MTLSFLFLVVANILFLIQYNFGTSLQNNWKIFTTDCDNNRHCFLILQYKYKLAWLDIHRSSRNYIKLKIFKIMMLAVTSCFLSYKIFKFGISQRSYLDPMHFLLHLFMKSSASIRKKYYLLMNIQKSKQRYVSFYLH